MADEEEELLKFRLEWEKEIKQQDDVKNKLRKKSCDVKSEGDLKKDLLEGIFQRQESKRPQELIINGGEGKSEINKGSTANEEIIRNKKSEIILLSLPNPEGSTGENEKCTKKQKVSKLDLEESHRSGTPLLEQLIFDIDEVTAIPFFDLQLPREVGMKILGHLSMWDLCQCAIVSKSWKSLAEDELLWFKIGVDKGFMSKCQLVVEGSNWKRHVRDSIMQNRRQQQRWRERVCRITPMDYERGGSLSAVGMSNSLVCAGYSTGTVLLWDFEGHDGPSYKLMDPLIDGQERPCVTATCISNGLCAAGFENGRVNIWQNMFPHSPVNNFSVDGPVKSVAIATNRELSVVALSENEVRVDVADANGRWRCRQQKATESKLQHMHLLQSTRTIYHQYVILTRDTIELHDTSGIDNVTLIDQVIGGKITCSDCTADTLAVGIGSYGYGILGNKVRLYQVSSCRLLALLSGHHYEITCINVRDSPPNRLITGSYDRRVRIFDTRCESPTQTLCGHSDYVTTVQMDEWKVVSGSRDGITCVWDQRMASMLWSTHARHPVRHCRFSRNRMLTANIPEGQFTHENSWYADDLILHRKNRGTLRLFDFEAENVSLDVPEICSSNYDDTTGYNYNIALATPYDVIDE
ncbi:predicted protein [Nematostella vectensis]|uniref:F-box domain-containing protein n=1 Tax=Nematostella vectensis TaxID=45351 RepID=A7S9E7_NEMVE|nr:F-box/WD repeat-containing protein 8 [Nematostella vectensis]EDO39658.1 predicted protein [Nematostella vectensis]|eukprot:XP_001631721.1 predicted protein [Nematostella vectensis]